MFVYKITCTANSKIYIGMDSGPVEKMLRWKSHQTLYFRKQAQGKPVKTKLGRAILKYGIESFKVEVVYRATDIEDLVAAETRLIKEHDSVKSGYNMLPGSQGYTLSSIEDPVVREYLRDIRRRGTNKVNEARWGNSTLEERLEQTKHLHTPEMAKKKSERMRDFWSERSDRQEAQLVGLKTQWQNLTLDEKHKRTQRTGGLFTSKSYIAVSPEGVVHQVDNMNKFCADRGLSPTAMRALARGVGKAHKGWTCKVKGD